MINGLQFINHWVLSGDVSFPIKHRIDKSYFDPVLAKVYDYVTEYCIKYDSLPSFRNVRGRFEEFDEIDKNDLDTVQAVVDSIRNEKVDNDLTPLMSKLIKASTDSTDFKASAKEILTEMDEVLRSVGADFKYYSWNKNSEDRFKKYMERHGIEGLIGYSFGFEGLDNITGGIQSDDFILITARTGNGKSLLGDKIGFTVWDSCRKADIRGPVLCFNTEMSATQVSYRLDTLKAHFSNSALRFGKLGDVECYEKYLKRLSDTDNEYVLITPDVLGREITAIDIRHAIEYLKPVLVIVDQLYDIKDLSGERDIRKQIINVTKALRSINLDTMTPMLVMAQTGREAAKEAKKDSKATPELHQIQESDNPAQKATKVITLRLDGTVMTVSLKKNRDGKKDENIFLSVNIDQGIWEETEDTLQNA